MAIPIVDNARLPKTAKDEHGWITFPDYRTPIQKNGESLWPERWPLWAPAARKNSMGPIAWAQEMENNPIPEDNSYFTLSKFEACYRDDLEFQWEYRGTNPTFIGVDTQISLKGAGDYGCLFVIEFDTTTEDRKILWIERGRWGFKITSIIEEFDRRYRPSKITVENNGAQDFIVQHLRDRDNLVPVYGFTTGENKPDILIGIPYLAATVEVQKWIIPRKGVREKELTDQWVREALEYGQGHSGDVLMASWFANDGAREVSYLGLTHIPSVENASAGERDFQSDHSGIGDLPQLSITRSLQKKLAVLNFNRGVYSPSQGRPEKGVGRGFRG